MADANQRRSTEHMASLKFKSLSLFIAALLYSGSGYAEQIQLNLPRQNLQASIQQLASQSGIEIVVATQHVLGHDAEPLIGQMSVQQALEQLLKNSQLMVKKQGAVYVIVEAKPTQSVVPPSENLVATEPSYAQEHFVKLQTIHVVGDKDRDGKGYDDVYEKNYSSSYAGKEFIERFKGTTPSDLLKGMSNVYSGDARNSGALDPNIRGLQGQGRVPVTIDGTEQSLTIWRGYNGDNSRSYIDPNLIRSIQVVKGATLNSGIKTGIAGGVAAKTLEADDIIKPGKRIGSEIKLEGTNNSVQERLPTSYAGRDYRDVMDELGIKGWSNIFDDPLVNQTPHQRSDQNVFNLEDQAFRVAVAAKQDQFDVLAAYAYRSRGNYFAGSKGSDFFRDDSLNEKENVMVPNMAEYFGPNGEVTNSSSNMTSYLLKGTWRPNDDQALQLSYRDSTNRYGELMPSRIWWFSLDGLPQWPLSEVNSKAYQFEYHLNPIEQRWLDLKINVWQSNTQSKTYSSGGFVNTLVDGFDSIYTYCHPNSDQLTESQLLNDQSMCDMYQQMYGGDRTPNQSYLIQDTASTRAHNTRRGIRLSNTFQMFENLNLTLGADLSKEKLRTDDEFIDARSSYGTNFRMLPRAGRRSENQYHFNFDWKPTHWLNLTAGAKSVSYWSIDDFLNQNRTNSDISTLQGYVKEVAKKMSYTESVDHYTQAMFDDEVANGSFAGCAICSRRAKAAIGTAYTYTRIAMWYPDAYGKYHAKDNPLLNGTVQVPYDRLVSSDNGLSVGAVSVVEEFVENSAVQKSKDHKNWAPAISAAITLNANHRIYLNYNEAYRLPSLFETTLGFSASQSGYGLKPEHAKNWEIAYVFNMSDLFNIKQGFADFKLAYFNHKTHDVIERNNQLKFTNMDLQKTAGWELASRYDHGKYFGDLSLVWNRQNKVCDESESLLMTNQNAIGMDIANPCIKYGYRSGYLVNMALPEYQANLILGTRLLDNKLELGSRIAYFEGFKNPYINVPDVSWFNQPLQWRNTWTYDAYVHYQHNDSLGFDVVGSNLSNEYYLDPISRSATPAPGRSLKLSVNYKF